MPGYLVRWSLLITADTPEAAAHKAAALVRDPAEPTTVFDVLSAHDWTPSGPGVLAQVAVPHPVTTYDVAYDTGVPTCDCDEDVPA